MALVRDRLAAAARCCLLTIAWVMVIIWLAFYMRLSSADNVEDKIEERFFSKGIPYHYAGADGKDQAEDPFLFQGSQRTLANAFEWFIPPLIAAICVALCELLPASRTTYFSRTRSRVLRVLGWQLPGRNFWSWWCGGVCIGEALFYCGFLIAIALRMEYYLRPQYDEWNAIAKVVELESIDATMMRLDDWAKYLGLLGYPCFMALFWPVAHDSFLNHMLGISWQNAIKYHRWMGHVTMWVFTAHGACYVAFWCLEQNFGEGEDRISFWSNAFSWKDSHPHLAGIIAWAGGFALQLTSVWYIRRRWFDLFYRIHIAGFVILVIFANMHFSRAWTWFLPGLMPWAVDLIFRFAQGASITTFTSASLSDDHSVATLELTVEKGVEVQPLHDYLINVPTISRWGWHPFTCAGQRLTGDGRSTVTFNIKRYGPFTTALFRSLEDGLELPVRVQGPVGLRSHADFPPWLRYPVLVCVVGGIGISPVLSMLQGIVRDRAGRKGDVPAAGPKRVIMVWASRHKAEFCVLPEPVLAAANEPDGFLEVNLHYTGKHMTRASSAHHAKLPMDAQPTLVGKAVCSRAGALLDSSDSNSESGGATPCGRGSCPLGLDTLSFRGFSPLGFSTARPVQPKVGSTWQKIAVILLAHIGGFCGLSLASAYYGEGNAIGKAGKKDKEFFTWVNGLLTILGAIVGVLGLPTFAVHSWAAWRYVQSTSGRKVAATEPSFTDSDASGPTALRQLDSLRRSAIQPTARYASSLVGGRVGFPESGMMLDIVQHRPDIRGVLQEAAAEAADIADGADVGVYVAGPQGMVQATKKLVADLNSARPRGTPALHFNQETWEL